MTVRARWVAIAGTLAIASVARVGVAADDTEAAGGKVRHVATPVEHAVVRGAQAAASGVARGAKAAAHGVKVGVKAAARGIETGARATARVADRVAKKVDPDAP